MHELSIAQSILTIVNEAIPSEHLKKIKTIYLQIGSLSGIEIDALTFSFDILKERTAYPSAKLSIEIIEAQGKCKNCSTIFKYKSFGFACPTCGSYSITIISGKEMKVVGIEVD
ncbi:MAG: hydrogenase maturation nickel metallochaperone HypA [Bacteroidales bacterium]|nr:hydrogenase maturation nickel metallochaperone HypA [Bacteroidales bacterium]